MNSTLFWSGKDTVGQFNVMQLIRVQIYRIVQYLILIIIFPSFPSAGSLVHVYSPGPKHYAISYIFQPGSQPDGQWLAPIGRWRVPDFGRTLKFSLQKKIASGPPHHLDFNSFSKSLFILVKFCQGHQLHEIIHIDQRLNGLIDKCQGLPQLRQ